MGFAESRMEQIARFLRIGRTCMKVGGSFANGYVARYSACLITLSYPVIGKAIGLVNVYRFHYIFCTT